MVIGAWRADDRHTRSELRERIAELPVRKGGNAAGGLAVGGGRSQCVGADKDPMVAVPGRAAKRRGVRVPERNANPGSMLLN